MLIQSATCLFHESVIELLAVNNISSPRYEFKTRLIDEGYNPAYGARPLRRAVMRLLEDSLAEEFLSEKIKPGDTAVVDVDKNGTVKVLLGENYSVLS